MSKAAEIVTCNETADAFQKLYYEKLDKQRHGTHGLVNLYMPEATLTWNGNTAKGRSSIAELLGTLPMSTCHIHSVDAQPINEKAFNNKAIMVAITGNIRYSGIPDKEFAQTFILQKTDSATMKISYDCFRFLNEF